MDALDAILETLPADATQVVREIADTGDKEGAFLAASYFNVLHMMSTHEAAGDSPDEHVLAITRQLHDQRTNWFGKLRPVVVGLMHTPGEIR